MGDALLIGGPRNETLFDAQDVALVELEINGLMHRYVRTTRHRDWDGRTLRVYNYDGVFDPDGVRSAAKNR